MEKQLANCNVTTGSKIVLSGPPLTGMEERQFNTSQSLV